MDKFSKNQAVIAKALFGGPKTIEEIKEKTGLSFDVVSLELKELLKLGFVGVSGYPSKYSLKKEIQLELERRKDLSNSDSNQLRLKAVIDVHSVLEEGVVSSLKKVEEGLRKDKDFTIYGIFIAKPLKQEERFTSYLEADLSVKDFKSLVKLMYFFGPTSIEVLKPQKYVVLIEDLQDGLMDMAEMIQSYNYYIIKQMNKSELEQFQKKLLDK